MICSEYYLGSLESTKMIGKPAKLRGIPTLTSRPKLGELINFSMIFHLPHNNFVQ